MSNVEKIILEMSVNQAQLLSAMAEIGARLYIGQPNVLGKFCDASWDDLEKVKLILYKDLNLNSNKSINDIKLSDDARQLWDVYQVLRFFLSWKDQPNTPEERDWKKQMGVNFDSPTKTSQSEELIKIYKRIDYEYFFKGNSKRSRMAKN